MASPENEHCADCNGTLRSPIKQPRETKFICYSDEASNYSYSECTGERQTSDTDHKQKQQFTTSHRVSSLHLTHIALMHT